MIRAYLDLFLISCKSASQYRAAALAALATQIFWGILRLAIFTAFYQTGVGQPSITLEQTTVYIWISQIMLQIIPWNLDKQLQAQILRGDVAYDLLRPMNLWWFWYTKALAMRALPIIYRGVPILIIIFLFFNFQLPTSVLAACNYLISTFLAVLLSSALTTFFHITLIWTVYGEGITRLIPSIVALFSGLLLPLPLMPTWLHNIAWALPFKGIIDTPFFFYMGMLDGPHAIACLAHQIVWIVLMILASQALLHRGLKKIEIVGG